MSIKHHFLLPVLCIILDRLEHGVQPSSFNVYIRNHEHRARIRKKMLLKGILYGRRFVYWRNFQFMVTICDICVNYTLCCRTLCGSLFPYMFTYAVLWKGYDMMIDILQQYMVGRPLRSIMSNMNQNPLRLTSSVLPLKNIYLL